MPIGSPLCASGARSTLNERDSNVRQAYENALVTGRTGSYHYRKLIDWYDHEPILDISAELRLTRREAMKYDIANFRAIKNLEGVLRALKIKTVAQLAAIDPYSMHNTEGVGYTTLYVAMCILDKHGHDPISWWGWEKAGKRKHAAGSKQPVKMKASNGTH
jgi:hypothetical protein